MKNSRATLLITGDLVITEKKYEVYKLDKKIIDLFQESDYNIINLECPVTGATKEITKTGPNIKSEREPIGNVMDALNVDLATLATNHILDYGVEGLTDTIEFCKSKKVDTTGVGENLQSAQKTFFKNLNEVKLGIINFAENEWSSAKSDCAGANPMDLIENIRQIKRTKEKADIVIVIVHGGHQFYNLPSPRMQKYYRFYIENGADLVVGHHTHCISGYEKYLNGQIFYGLGNFLFTDRFDIDEWYKGLILEVEINASGSIKTQLHPIKLNSDFLTLNLLEGREKESVLEEIFAYNSIIENQSFLEKKWDDFVELSKKTTLSYWSPSSYLTNRYIKAIFHRFGLTDKFLNTKAVALKLNLIRTESHLELAKATLSKVLDK